MLRPFGAGLMVTNSGFIFPVRIRPEPQRPIVGVANAAEYPSQLASLRRRWIATKPITNLHTHTIRRVSLYCKKNFISASRIWRIYLVDVLLGMSETEESGNHLTVEIQEPMGGIRDTEPHRPKEENPPTYYRKFESPEVRRQQCPAHIHQAEDGADYREVRPPAPMMTAFGVGIPEHRPEITEAESVFDDEPLGTVDSGLV